MVGALSVVGARSLILVDSGAIPEDSGAIPEDSGAIPEDSGAIPEDSCRNGRGTVKYCLP